MLGNALLCGKDSLLLDTRARLLKSAGIGSTITMSVAEIESIPCLMNFDLAVLGQLLTNDEVNEAVRLVRRRWPNAKILIFHMSDEEREEMPECAYIRPLGAPSDFITRAVQMLTAS
jgi:hypothetical protein